MKEITWKQQGSWLVADVRFGILDSKGREMGVKLIVKTKEDRSNYELVGESWLTMKKVLVGPLVIGITSCILSTRDGECFGGGFPTDHDQESIEAAKSDCLKRCETSRKKVERKAAANGGVYK